MTFDLNEFHRDVPDDVLIADLRIAERVLTRDGKVLSFRSYNEVGRYSAGTIAQRFGSWNKAVVKAGFRPTQEKNVSHAALFDNLRTVWLQKGKQPTFRDMALAPSQYSTSLYIARFGNWRTALNKFVAAVQSDRSLRPDDGIDNAQAHEAAELSPATKKRTGRNPSDRLRFRILLRDGFQCQSCGASPSGIAESNYTSITFFPGLKVVRQRTRICKRSANVAILAKGTHSNNRWPILSLSAVENVVQWRLDPMQTITVRWGATVENAEILSKVSSGELSIEDAMTLLTTPTQVIVDSPLSPIECKILNTLTEAVNELQIAGRRDGSAVWTRKVKIALRDLGRREGHFILGDAEASSPQWLFDLAWARSETGDLYGLTGLALAVEIEWNTNDHPQLEDFLKLTVTNAELCLFIFDMPLTPDYVERKFNLLKDACRVPRGLRYFVVGIESLRSTPFKVQCRAWTR